MPYWEPRAAWLIATDAHGVTTDIACFPLPFTAPGMIEADLVAFDETSPDAARSAIALCDAPLMRTPHAWYAGIATWQYDPEGTFEGTRQILAFGRAIQDATRPAIEAGASGFIGALAGYSGDSCRYYVP